jgi:hypothetical protein
MTTDSIWTSKTRWPSKSDLNFVSSQKLNASTKPIWNIFGKWLVTLVRRIHVGVDNARAWPLKNRRAPVFEEIFRVEKF